MVCITDKPEIVKMLLAHPSIDVNVRALRKETPLHFACKYDSFVVPLLLKDKRVDATLIDDTGYTAFDWSIKNGLCGTAEMLIASGKELGDPVTFIDRPGGSHLEQKIAARKLNDRFKANPTLTRYECRVKLEVPETVAAQLFAFVVFLCDGLLALKEYETRETAWPNIFKWGITKPQTPPPMMDSALRFFKMAQRLPMELQMILCHRVLGRVKDNIPSKDSELAFRALAEKLVVGGKEEK